MDRIDIIEVTIWVGLACATFTGIFSNLFHKWKKIGSFKISETTEQIIVERNFITNLLSNIAYFFILSLFSILAATNTFNFYIELSSIYLICLLLAIENFIKKKNYKIVIEKGSRNIIINSKAYPPKGNIFETSFSKS